MRRRLPGPPPSPSPPFPLRARSPSPCGLRKAAIIHMHHGTTLTPFFANPIAGTPPVPGRTMANPLLLLGSRQTGTLHQFVRPDANFRFPVDFIVRPEQHMR